MPIKDKNYFDLMKDYINKNLKKGYTQESLKWALVNQGYSKLEVEKALRAVNQEMSFKAPILEAKVEQASEPVSESIIEKKSFWRRIFG